MRPPRTSPAFTLIELVLVLVVLTVLLAIAAPSLRGWSRGTRLRDAGEQVLAAARYARSQAVTTGANHRVEFDAGTNAYRVTALDGEQYTPAAGEFGREIALPQGITLGVTREDGDVSGVVTFYPSGRTTPARITLSADWGETSEIEATTAAEPFRLVTADATTP
jgi:prepilin-type N-terminal cleavage/methylation domain-containing protein